MLGDGIRSEVFISQLMKYISEKSIDNYHPTSSNRGVIDAAGKNQHGILLNIRRDV